MLQIKSAFKLNPLCFKRLAELNAEPLAFEFDAHANITLTRSALAPGPAPCLGLGLGLGGRAADTPDTSTVDCRVTVA